MQNARSARTPVVGSLESMHRPTSGDVHLFHDPSTADTERPCFYADCEGLKGGRTAPVAEEEVSQIRGLIRGISRERHREVKVRWKTKQSETRDREFMVKTLYPRVLFTFSDLVVYVTPNQRSVTFDTNISLISNCLGPSRVRSSS